MRKYYCSPRFRSDQEARVRWKVSVSRRQNDGKGNDHNALNETRLPHPRGPSEISVEVKLRVAKRTRNSTTILPSLKLMETCFGFANPDLGRPGNGAITGAAGGTDDREMWTSAARQKGTGEVFPGRLYKLLTNRRLAGSQLTRRRGHDAQQVQHIRYWLRGERQRWAGTDGLNR